MSEDKGNDLIPEGAYKGTLESIEAGKGEEVDGKKKASFVKLVWNITHSKKGEVWEERDNIKEKFLRTMYLYLSEKARKYTADKLEMIGFAPPISTPTFDAEKATGVELICRHSTYQGKTSDKWDFAQWGGGEVTPIDANVGREFDSYFKATHGA